MYGRDFQSAAVIISIVHSFLLTGSAVLYLCLERAGLLPELSPPGAC